MICVWLALRKTTPQIIELLDDRFNIDMSFQNIDKSYRYAKRWKKLIAYIRKRFLNNISSIPIANKAYRLAALQEALDEALTYHIKTKNQWGTIREKKIGTIAQIIEGARKEIEGEKSLIDNSKHTHIHFFKEAVIKAGEIGENGRINPGTNTKSRIKVEA